MKNIVVFYDKEQINDLELLINSPNKLFTNLKSMTSLNLELFGLKELTKNIFANNFEMIQCLSINRYQEDTLPENIFMNTPNITELHITHNNLKSLPSHIFENLKFLQILDLSCNKLKIMSMSVLALVY